MKLSLDPAQTEQAESLFAIGEKRYGEPPVIIGQIRKNTLPDEPGGWHLAAIAVRQSVARKIKTLLEKERTKL